MPLFAKKDLTRSVAAGVIVIAILTPEATELASIYTHQ
ncbi:hypothetical protein SPWS13_0269 [Shewanella putrefaciens]|nr:hypothetical protein SPWS13_0269 [Shewanella putrefaciens]